MPRCLPISQVHGHILSGKAVEPQSVPWITHRDASVSVSKVSSTQTGQRSHLELSMQPEPCSACTLQDPAPVCCPFLCCLQAAPELPPSPGCTERTCQHHWHYSVFWRKQKKVAQCCPGAAEDKRCPLQPMPVKALGRGGCSNAGRQMRKAPCAVLYLPHSPVSSPHLLHTARLSRAQHRGCALSNMHEGCAPHPHPEAAPLLHSGIKPLVEVCGQHITSGGVAGAGRGGQTSPRCPRSQQA